MKKKKINYPLFNEKKNIIDSNRNIINNIKENKIQKPKEEIQKPKEAKNFVNFVNFVIEEEKINPSLKERNNGFIIQINEQIDVIKEILDNKNYFSNIFWPFHFIFVLSFILADYYLETNFVISIYCIFLLIFILYLTKSFWTFVIIISSCSILKYLVYDYNLSDYYSSTLIFDLHILFITLSFLFFLLLIEIPLIIFYIILFFIVFVLNSFKFISNISIYIFKKYSPQKKEGLIIQFIFLGFFILGFSYSLVIFLKLNINYLFPIIVTYSLVFIILITFIIFSIMLKHIHSIENQTIKRIYLLMFFKENAKLSFVFKFIFNFYKKISKIHDDLNFLHNYSFMNLNNFIKILFLIFSIILSLKLYFFPNYLNSISYHNNFYYDNNGYCTNLLDELLILKKQNRDSVLALSKTEIEKSFLIKSGDIKSKYYIYETECEHKYK